MSESFVEEVFGPAGDDLIESVHAAFARAGSHPSGVTEETRRMFELAVVEVLANIGAHSRSGRAVTVTMELTVGASGCLASIRDDAPPASVDLDGAEMPDALAESGRGLALVQAIVDRFEHSGDAAGNVWTLVLGGPAGRAHSARG